MADQNSVDKRIVQMEFDNEQFKKGTNETIRALNRLTESLQFQDASKGLSNVESAINRINLSGLERDVGTLSSRFTLFGNLAFNALNRVSNKILDATRSASSFISSLGQMANAASGFQKYEETVEATQTIMAATASEFEDTGEQMEFVSEQLDRLRWFTDETSYSFTDMASNIGKFTSAGVDLKTAVASMRGIAAWAALSGANAQKASIAMYNFSQSLGKGYMQLTDWRSLENINMATLEFKQQLIDLAIEMGKVEKVGEGMYRAIGANAAHVFSAEGMSEYLSDRWFDTELIQKVLAQYGDFSGKLNALGDATGFTASEMLNMMDEFREGTLDLDKYAKIGGVGVQFLTDALTDLTSADMALGEKGLRAAQETKTFSDAINYVKDAVSSGWSKTFELIIGNEQQAIDFWSDFAEEMYDIFVKAGDDRNELLAEWNEMGGRNLFIESIFNGLTAIKSLIEPIKEGFHDIFPPATAETLYNLTERLRDFTQGLILNEQAQEVVRVVARKVFSVFSSGIAFVKNLFRALSPLGLVIKDIGTNLGIALLSFTSNRKGMLDLNDILTVFTNVVYSLALAITTLYAKIRTSKGLSNIFNTITGGISSLGSGALKKINSFANYILQFGNAIKEFIKSIGENGFSETVKSFTDRMAEASGSLNQIYTAVKDFYSRFKDFYQKYFSDMTLKDILNLGIMGYFTVALVKHLRSLNKTVGTVQDLLDTLIDQVNNIGNAKSKLIKAKAVKELAESLGIVALAIMGLANFVNLDTIIPALASLGTAMVSLWMLSKSIENIELSPLKVLAVVEFAMAVGILAGAITKIATLYDGSKESWNKFAQTILSFIVVIGTLGALGMAFTKLSKTTSIIEEGKKVLEKLNLFGLASTLLGLAVAVNILVIALRTIGNPENLKIIQDGMDAFLQIMAVLAGAVFVMEIPQAFSKSAFKNMASTVLSMGIFLMAAAHAIQSIGSLDFKTLLKGGATVGMLMAILGGIVTVVSGMTALGGGLAGAAATILAMAVALDLLVYPITALRELKVEELARGIVSVGAALVMLGVGLLAINTINIKAQGTLKSAVALLTVAAAIEVVALAVKTIAALPMLEVVGALVALGVALAGLTIVAKILEPLSGGLIAVGGGLLMISGAAALFSVAIGIIVGSLVLLGNLAPGAIQNAATALIKLGPALGEAAGLALNSLVETFDKYAYEIAHHFVSGLVKGIIGMLTGAITGIYKALTSFFSGIAEWVENNDPNIKAYAAEKGQDAVAGFEEGASKEAPNLYQQMAEIGTQAANATSDAGLNNQNGNSIGLDFISAITGGATSEGGELIDVFGALGSDSENALAQFLNNQTGGGIATDFMGGMNDAIGQNANTILNNLIRFGNNAVNVTSSALNAVTTMISTMNSAYATGQKLSKETLSQLQKQRAEAVQKTNKSQLKGAAARMAIVESDLGTKTYDYSKEVRAAMSQLNNYGQQALDDWKKFSSDYVSSTDWKSIGSAAGNELGEGLKSGAGGGGGSGRKGGASGTAKEMAKVIEGECKVVMNETGHYIAENICAGLKEDSTIEEVAAGKAKNIKSAFQEVFDQFDLYQDYYDAQYDLWVAANPDATEIEKRRQELKNLGQQMTTVTKKLNAAQDELAQLSEELGEGSNEVVTMATEVTRLETELENLNNTYNERAQLEPGVYIPEADLYKNGEIDYREVGMVFPEELVNMLAEIKGDFKSSGEELAAELTAGMTGQLTDDEEYLLTSIRTLMETTEVPILDSYDNYVDAGENLIFGFAKGITSKNALARVEESSAYVANLATDTLNATLDINSPSKVAGISGRFFDEGFANNILKYGFLSEDATQAMGENTIGVLQDTLKTVSDLVTADYEYSPVIKPIVDTTNVATAADYITSTFATPSSIRLGSRPDTPFNRNLRAIRLSMQDQEDYNYSREDETVSAINNLGSKLDKQEAAIRAMQVVMDSGELVGSIAGGMDQGLGTRAKYKRRGN